MAIQIRRGNDAEWESNKSNIVAGEPAVTLDSERMFVGTGSGTYMELANLDVLADAFDSSASYEVGDFVAYHGKVYKCNTDHSGAWNASDFDEVALADELDSLGDNVYTKTEVDTALGLKPDKSDTYTKTEVDSSLALKADKSDTFTKAEVNSALALKADKSDTYTKEQVDDEITDLNNAINKIKSDLEYQPELNLIDVSKISEGYELANQLGGVRVNETWYVTDWIEVEPNTKYTVSGVSSFYRAEVGADKSSYTGLGQNVATFTTGESTKYVRFNSLISGYSTPQLQLGDTATPYEPYKLVPQRIVDIETEINDLSSDTLEIVLPDKIMCAVGKQISIYHKNILLCDNDDNYIISWGMNNFTPYVRCYDDCIQIKPTQEVADTTCSLEVRSKFSSKVIASKTFHMQAYDTSLSKRVVFIGDSLTDRAIYIAGVIENSENGVTSIGTISDTVELDGITYNILDEGRSGWYTTNYISSASYNGFTNAFYNPISETFDFSYYVSNNLIGAVDAVCILLGTNDLSMSNIDYDATIANIQDMINSIHSYDNSIKVILGLTPQGALQSGWGNSNGRTGTATWFDYRAKTLVSKMIDAFSNASNIYLSPVYVNLSAVYDFPSSEVAESDRNPTLVARETDNVHPNTYGYLKIADTIYGTLCGAFA